jgi:uracil-DNA glycosylase
MVVFDKGPPAVLARHFAELPDIDSRFRSLFWYDWGPVFYRGRLTGKARLLGIASDPGPTERVACRTLVGDAGQRVQGFLDKIGLTRSYVLVNAFPIAVHPGKVSQAQPLLEDGDQLAWRNRYYDLVTGPELEAIVAFGANAQRALDLWDGRPDVPTFEVPHPSSHDTRTLLEKWRTAVPDLRAAVTPDRDGTQGGANYGSTFKESDYRPIPRADLPFGLPPWVGDDSWVRRNGSRRHNSVERARSNQEHTLLWQAPTAAELALQDRDPS